jgi:hypothetical protein
LTRFLNAFSESGKKRRLFSKFVEKNVISPFETLFALGLTALELGLNFALLTLGGFSCGYLSPVVRVL